MYKQINIEDKYSVIRIADSACIPPDPLNRDYQNYLAWLDDGNEPSPPDEPIAPKPTFVKMRQARLALHAAGLLDDVESRIAVMQKEAQIDWEFAETVERNSALVAELGVGLGLTEAQLDDLFLTASTL